MSRYGKQSNAFSALNSIRITPHCGEMISYWYLKRWRGSWFRANQIHWQIFESRILKTFDHLWEFNILRTHFFRYLQLSYALTSLTKLGKLRFSHNELIDRIILNKGQIKVLISLIYKKIYKEIIVRWSVNDLRAVWIKAWNEDMEDGVLVEEWKEALSNLAKMSLSEWNKIT